ncbi:putative D,D-dipeptide transport system permease protein DdpC [compost metagenome]
MSAINTSASGFLKETTRYPTVIAGAILLGIILLIAFLTPLLSNTDPSYIDAARRAQPASASHWFGTDMLGRDLYTRVLYGAQVSLIVGFAVAVLSTIGGLAIGLMSGFVKAIDTVVMRFMDGLMSIPAILLAVALMSISKGSVTNVIIAITIAEIPRTARLVRGTVLSLREQPYVEAAVAGGTRLPTIIFKHILPNTLAPLIVQATYVCAAHPSQHACASDRPGDLCLRQRDDFGIDPVLHRSGRASRHSLLGQYHGRGACPLAGEALHHLLPGSLPVDHGPRHQSPRRRTA